MTYSRAEQQGTASVTLQGFDIQSLFRPVMKGILCFYNSCSSGFYLFMTTNVAASVVSSRLIITQLVTTLEGLNFAWLTSVREFSAVKH